MSKQDVNDFLEVLAEAIYRGVGKARTKVFNLDDRLFPLYPPSRMHFNYTEMVYSEKVDEIIDELANQKAHMLAIKLVSEKIVTRLSAAPGTKYDDESITVNDYLSKMFLESGKGSFNTDVLANSLLDDFEKTITVKPEAVAEALVDKCDTFL